MPLTRASGKLGATAGLFSVVRFRGRGFRGVNGLRWARLGGAGGRRDAGKARDKAGVRDKVGVRGTVGSAGHAATATCLVGGLLLCAGCSGPGSSAPRSLSSASAGSGPAALPSRSVPSPGCSAAVAGRGLLPGVRTAMVRVPAGPFGVVWAPGGRWAFATVAAGVEVLRAGGSLALVLVRMIPLPGSPEGEAITPDGLYLLAADGSGAAVISVARAEQGASGAVIGTLGAAAGASPGHGAPTARMARALSQLNTAAEVAVSPDGRFAFVTLEYADRAAVFNLGRALISGFGAADYVGAIPLGESATGLAVAPDGRWLYATSEVAVTAAIGAGAGAAPLSAAQAAACPETYQGEPPGTLTVISLGQAETDPAGSVTATVDAGFQPVRVITAAAGAQVWVTARASDDLLGFSAARLAADPARALLAVVRVDAEPVGLTEVNGGSLIVVADSDRFAAPGATAGLDVISVAGALAGRDAVLGRVATGSFPRELAAWPGPGGTLLVTNNLSSQVEAVRTASLPDG